MKNVYSETNRSFYDRISHSYDLIADSGEHAARERGERALDLQPGESVLEIGFGTGNSLLDFAERAGAEGVVAGIDISPKMRDVAAGKLKARALDGRVALKISDARQLPYEDGAFDAVFMSFTLELFPPEDIPLVLDEVARVLKPEGRVGIVCMSNVPEGDRPSVLEKTYVWMHRHFPHIVDCRPIDATRYLSESGFTISSEDSLEIWSMPVRVAVGALAPAAAHA